MDRTRRRRRTVLASIGTVGTGLFAGCVGDGSTATEDDGSDDEPSPTDSDENATPTDAETDPTSTDTAEPTSTDTAEPTSTDTAEPTPDDGPDEDSSTPSSEEEQADIYVAPEGSDDGAGTADDPLRTIGTAFEQVQPGETIYANPGEYQEALEIGEGGTADSPIELTGPPDAVLRRPPEAPAIALIGGDHIHITGLTIDGLADPDSPEDPDAYGDGPLLLFTAREFDEFNEGAVAAPHQIGNSGRQLVKFRLCANAEAGPFRVTGRAGAKWQLTDESAHNGEIVYVGTALTTVEGVEEWSGWDRTHEVRVHHIDNSAGHPHSELVDVKPGTENVTIEYCTDGGGSQNNVDWDASVVNFSGHQSTFRWNRIEAGEGNGLSVGTDLTDKGPDDDVADRVATENEIYGNEILGFDDQWAIGFHPGSEAGQGPEDQSVYCGNTVEGMTDGDPESECSDDVPSSDTVGHEGGDSPWG